jgi:hypothetical protein
VPRVGKDGAVSVDRSELSSLASLLDQVTQRVTAMAETASGGRDEDLAVELFGIERALAGARRRFERLLGAGR